MLLATVFLKTVEPSLTGLARKKIILKLKKRPLFSSGRVGRLSVGIRFHVLLNDSFGCLKLCYELVDSTGVNT